MRCDAEAGNGPAPRYEFRVFGGDLEEARARLAEMAEPGSETQREDTYLVVRGRLDCGLKLRGSEGTLDLKCLIGTESGCELWKPAGKANLPLTGSEITRRFLQPAGLPEILTAFESFDEPALLEALADLEDMRIVRMGKRRRQVSLDQAAGEIGEFIFPDAHREQGLAVEATDVRRLRALVEALGLADRENVSLPRRLETYAFGPRQEAPQSG
jgi:hypothetical protein